MSNNVLGINKYLGWTVNSNQVYGIRGVGKDYDIFWQLWYTKVSDDKGILWRDDDWPWSYFTLTEKWEKDLERVFESVLDECTRDSPDYNQIVEPYKSSPVTNLLYHTLQAELTKEADQLIIDRIKEKINE